MIALSKAAGHIEGQHYLHAVKDQAPVRIGIFYIPVCIRDMDAHS